MNQVIRTHFRFAGYAAWSLLLSLGVSGCATLQPNTCEERTPASTSQLNPTQAQACEQPVQHRDLDMNLYRNGGNRNG